MADYNEKLRDKNFQNWVKASLGLCLTREGLLNLVVSVVNEFHLESLSSVLSSDQIERGHFCTQCKKESILKCPTKGLCTVRALKCSTHGKERLVVRPCPNGICDMLRDAIIKGHSFHYPSWKNTHAERWCQNPWEIAKCFMPPDGYLEAKSIDETDLNGILSVMYNLKRFERKVSKKELDEVRGIGRKIRHSSDLSVEDNTLSEYLDKMILFLKSTDDLLHESVDTVIKLEKLKADDLVISTEDVTKLLQDTINESFKSHLQDIQDRKDKYLLDIKEALDKGMARESKFLSDVLTAREEVLKDIEQARRASILDIDNHQKYSSCSSDDYEKRKSELKEDLVTFYEDVHSSVRVSPLVPENDAPILEFYVQQKIENVDWRRPTQPRKLLNSYKEVFTEESRNIYIVSQAGVGKTTFMKRLCAVWCYSQHEQGKVPENLSDSAVDVLKKFNFLFLVLLADVQDECDVDDMIEGQIIASLSRSRRYDKDFMEQLLHQEKCLVLLDGLDEWSHPDRIRCHKRSSIPHRKSRKNWTIISTTRPWQIHQAQLSNVMIDKYLELSELDDATVLKFAEKVVCVLDTVNKKEKHLDDFIKETREKGINELTYTPLLLVQMICLWHDDQPLGKTKCQIYSNIILFIVKQGKTKLQKCPLKPVPDNHIGRQMDPPVCLQGFAGFQDYYCYLIDVGNFAYKALTSENRESSLVLGTSITEDALPKETLQFCLHTGIVTESRMRSNVSEHVSTFSFIHQTFQEYFCALYLAALPDDTCVQKITTLCRSVAKILELSNVIIFLSGLRPDRLNSISRLLSGVIANDSLTLSFRRTIGTSIDWNTRFKHMKELQNMYISCTEECKVGFHNMDICVEDLFIDSDCRNQSFRENVRTLIEMNTQMMKSLKMYDYHITRRISSSVKQYNLDKVRTLERLEIVGELEETQLMHLLNGSAETLICISMCKDLRRYGQQIETKILTPVKSFNIIQSMPNLECLMLECFKLPHSQLEDLFKCVSNRHTMKQIGLGFLQCSDHGGKCNGVHINLSGHSCLQMLQLGDIPLSDVKINTTALERSRIGKFQCSQTSVVVLSDVLDCVHGAEKLRELMCFDFKSPEDVFYILQTLPLLEKLQVVVFKRVDFKDQQVHLPFGINHIKLCDVQMSSVAFRNLVDQSDNVPVKFELFECRITPDDEYQTIKTILNASERYIVWCDEVIQGNEEEFAFNKVVKGSFGDKK